MNYRHAYHAGNFSDVMKHAVVALIVEYLKAKSAPFFVLDTHAGIGRYDLESTAAVKTGEADTGVRRLTATSADAALAPYLDAVRAANGGAFVPLRWYPGSPRVVRTLMRPGDRLALAELHLVDGQLLAGEFRDDRQVEVHRVDGYDALKAFLPPREKRGLVLVDPPFEDDAEWQRLVAGLVAAHRRWPHGIFALWHPIKARGDVDAFHDALRETRIARILTIELLIRKPEDSLLLNGSGLVVVNPPWTLKATLDAALPDLARILAQGPGGGARTDWLVPENAGGSQPASS